MQNTVSRRLFDRLSDLVPDISSPLEGANFYTPPRLKGETAIYCSVSKVQNDRFKLEIAHDTVTDGPIRVGQSLVFEVNPVDKTAVLVELEDQWRYEVVFSGTNAPNPRRSQLNVFAVNHLTMLINLNRTFRPIDAFIAIAA